MDEKLQEYVKKEKANLETNRQNIVAEFNHRLGQITGALAQLTRLEEEFSKPEPLPDGVTPNSEVKFT